jgi:Legume lectin domain/Bacterial Ig-like domain (group 3)/Chitobiase/beta-hexosaminidase C-terminal domain
MDGYSILSTWATLLVVCGFQSPPVFSQVNVTTYHYDNARTGQNVQETVLTPSNVNVNQFGKLFTVPVDGYVYAQPLYLSGLSIAGGTHNVLYVATEHDSVYAIDADDGTVLWHQSFIDPAAGITPVSNATVGCTDLVPEVGITSTPVIDPGSGTIYVLAITTEHGTQIHRLHALDVSNGSEKFGGPAQISATVNGTGEGGSTIIFNALTQLQRPGLLLDHGHIIIGWASYCDNPPYHGWVMSYAAGSLTQEAVFNASPNGSDAGIWQSGDGIAADPSGNLFLVTGNGTYDGNSNGDYGDSILKLSPPNAGTFNVSDWFTPHNESTMNTGDADLGAGGVLLLPDLSSSSAHPHLLVQQGKSGTIYLVDRDNMGQYCAGCSRDPQIVQEIVGASRGVLGSPSYWNGNVYWGGGREAVTDTVKNYTFNAGGNGLVSTAATSRSFKTFRFSTAAPVISSNDNFDGILWILDNGSFQSSCCQILYAYDATDLRKLLYNSSLAPNGRDTIGGAVKFTAPTVANGKVYVGSRAGVSAFGIIDQTHTVAAPVFSLLSGTYSGPITVAITDPTLGAAVHCTADGSSPTATSPLCGNVPVNATTTIQAIGTLAGFNNSTVVRADYKIAVGGGINYGAGFIGSGLKVNGSAFLNGSRLRLTSEVASERGSAFFNTPVNVQSFTTDFTIQQLYAQADGMTFCIQNTGLTALGASGGSLGYGPDSVVGIGKSVAIKFDLLSNSGEGLNTVGLYTNGTMPTIPASDLTPSGIDLHSGEVFSIHIDYDGTVPSLTMRIVNTSTPWISFTKNWTIDIPGIVGGQTAFVGFTGATGSFTGIQDILAWTYYTPNSVATTPAPTSTSLGSSANPSTSNQPITFAAKVTSSFGVPAGSVTFKDGSNTLITTILDSSGTATLTISSLSIGIHAVTAFYNGDTLFATSTSSTLTEIVNSPQPAFTIVTTLDTKTIIAGQNAEFDVSLTPQNGSTATVALTCSVSPALPKCAIKPLSIVLLGSGLSTARATITTISHATSSSQQGMFGTALVGLMGMLVILWKKPRRLLATAAALLIALVLSCGGGSNKSGARGGTPSGNYTITVTGTSGSVSHAITVTLVVI